MCAAFDRILEDRDKNNEDSGLHRLREIQDEGWDLFIMNDPPALWPNLGTYPRRVTTPHGYTRRKKERTTSSLLLPATTTWWVQANSAKSSVWLKLLQMSSSLSTQRPESFPNLAHRFPPENLTHIFRYTYQSKGNRRERAGFPTTITAEHGKGIVALTHVCRYWRVILLSNPKLWTTANLTDPFMTAALLERSDSMPIIATYITPNPNAPVPSTETLLPHFSRIQKVHINAPLGQLIGFLSNLHGLSVTLEVVELECMSVGGQNDDEDDEDQADWEMWTQVFDGLSPLVGEFEKLEKPQTRSVPFSSYFSELHHLTHPELSYTANWYIDHLAIMAANTMLEVVILRGTREWEGETDDLGTAAVSLPRLRRLELYHLLTNGILEALVLPPGIHFACAFANGSVIPRSDGLVNIFTVKKLRFAFSER